MDMELDVQVIIVFMFLIKLCVAAGTLRMSSRAL